MRGKGIEWKETPVFDEWPHRPTYYTAFFYTASKIILHRFRLRMNFIHPRH